MKLHANAHTCPKSRFVDRLEGDWSLMAAAERR